jgi:hypothetical protein
MLKAGVSDNDRSSFIHAASQNFTERDSIALCPIASSERNLGFTIAALPTVLERRPAVIRSRR